ncbi:cation:proton antiporter [Candidatus Poribacteria bacterium]|nr:cation:proton antiporter [Candidatus Poribacteria bacterium]
MINFFLAISIVILFLVFLCLYRALFGPGIMNRIIAVNVIGTKTIAILLIIGFLFNKIEFFIDISLVYAVINFIGTIAFSKYFERKGVQ